MDSVARTAAVEAVQADIKTSRVIDAVEAQGAVFAIDGVGRLWWGEVGGGDVGAGWHFEGKVSSS